MVEAFRIPSSSMVPTLAVGDFLFVNKLAYGVRMPLADKLTAEWSQPARGDVIVFVYPCERSLDYIKRVVAVAGDIIDVDAHGFISIHRQDGKAIPFIETRVKNFESLVPVSGRRDRTEERDGALESACQWMLPKRGIRSCIRLR